MSHVNADSLQNTGNTLRALVAELEQAYLTKPEIMKKLNIEEETYYFTVLGTFALLTHG